MLLLTATSSVINDSKSVGLRPIIQFFNWVFAETANSPNRKSAKNYVIYYINNKLTSVKFGECFPVPNVSPCSQFDFQNIGD